MEDIMPSGSSGADPDDDFIISEPHTQEATTQAAAEASSLSATAAGKQPATATTGSLRSASDLPQAAVRLTTRSSDKVRRYRSSNEDQTYVKRLSRIRSELQPSSASISVTIDGLQSDVFRSITSRMEERGISTNALDRRQLNWCLPQMNDPELWERIVDDTLFVTPEELDQVLDLRDVSSNYNGNPTGVTSFYIRTFEFFVHELLEVVSELLAEGYDYVSKFYFWTERLQRVDPYDVVYVRYAGMSDYSPWQRHIHDLTAEPRTSTLRFIQKTLLLYPDTIQNALVQEVANARVAVSLDQSTFDLREQALISLLYTGVLNRAPGGKFNHEPTTKDEDMFAHLATRVTSLLPIHTKDPAPMKTKRIEKLVLRLQEFANENPVLTGTSIFSFSKAVQDSVVEGMKASTMHNGLTPFVTISSDIPLSVFKDPQTFYLEQSKTANIASSAINYFGHWEKGIGNLDTGFTSRLVADNHIPFVNLFPWPKKSDDTIHEAMRFLRQYLQTVDPLVVLTHGDTVSSVGLGSFKHSHGFPNRESGFLASVGELFLRNYSPENSEDRSSDYVVVIPSLHPGVVAYRGASTDISKAIFIMTGMKAWLAYHEALSHSNSSRTKSEICKDVIKAVKAKTGPGTAFDERFESLKEEFRQNIIKDRKNFVSEATRSAETAAVRAAARTVNARRLAAVRQQRSRDDTSALKVKYVIYSGSKGTIMVTPSSVWAQAKKELDMILSCGFSWSTPGSDDRKVEAERLFEKHVASLWNSNAVSGNKGQFFKFVNSYSVHKHDSFYLAAVEVEEAVKDLPNLIRCFMGDNIQDRYDVKWSRIFNYASQKDAFNNLTAWIKMHTAPASRDSEIFGLISTQWFDFMQVRDPAVYEVLKPVDSTGRPQERVFSTSDDLNGTEIAIKAHTSNYHATCIKHSVSWRTSEGNLLTMENLILPKSVMPTRSEEKRFIFFVAEGIDIKDQDGESIAAYHQVIGKRQAGRTEQSVYPTLSLASLILVLADHPHGNDFLKLWEDQTGLTVEAAYAAAPPINPSLNADEEGVIPTDYYSSCGPSRSLPLVLHYNAGAKTTVRGLLPIFPGDTLWLLNKFLEVAYPLGGDVKSSNPAEDLSGDSVHSKLTAFLQQPMYSKHPHLIELRSLTELARNGGNDSRRAGSTLKSAFDVLRGFVKDSFSSTIRVKGPNNPSKVIGVTWHYLKADVPADVMAPVDPPELVGKSTLPHEDPTFIEVVEENVDDQDEQEEEDDNGRMNPFGQSTSTSRNSKRGRDDDDEGGEDQPGSQRPRRSAGLSSGL